MDALSDVLRLVHLSGAVYLSADFTAPWCVFGEATRELCVSFLPRAERIVSYHLITEGSCRARLVDDPSSAICVDAGELLVVPQGEAHLMAVRSNSNRRPLTRCCRSIWKPRRATSSG